MCIAPPGGPSFLSRLGGGSEREVKKTRVPFKSPMIWEETCSSHQKQRAAPLQCVRYPETPTPGLHLGEEYGPQCRKGMPNWKTDLQGFFSLSPVIPSHLPVRGSIDYCSPFSSRMTFVNPSYFVNFPQVSSPSSFVQVSPMGGL